MGMMFLLGATSRRPSSAGAWATGGGFSWLGLFTMVMVMIAMIVMIVMTVMIFMIAKGIEIIVLVLVGGFSWLGLFTMVMVMIAIIILVLVGGFS